MLHMHFISLLKVQGHPSDRVHFLKLVVHIILYKLLSHFYFSHISNFYLINILEMIDLISYFYLAIISNTRSISLSQVSFYYLLLNN